MGEEKKLDIMSQKNKLVKWNPINGSSVLFVEAIHDDYEGFRVLLKEDGGESRMLKIKFESALSYKNTDESYMLKTWHNTSKEILGNIFYKIENSEYLSKFHEDSMNIYQDWKIKHFAIYTTQDCIDILSLQDPEIQWLN